ncbi:TetR/AcrR family transcriptional regulator [Cellulomonas sp. McL0617]|uniref:TetR/AcrR family transcriptional regulator n=1 Tax=Cellulomonas sp. McL0617 TaxID=3415675 RepID=UPI003CFAC80A
MTTTRRGPYAKTAGVRRRIVDAALSAFAETGYRSTTMKEIAQRAEISERGLVHHFPTKEDLLLEVLALYEEESAQYMPPDAEHGQIDGLLAVARHNLERSEMLELQNLLAAEGTSRAHPAHDRFVRRYHGLRIVLTQAFESMEADSASPSGVAPERLAAMYIGLLDGLQTQWLYDREAVDVEGSLKDFLTMVYPGVAFTPANSHLAETAP